MASSGLANCAYATPKKPVTTVNTIKIFAIFFILFLPWCCCRPRTALFRIFGFWRRNRLCGAHMFLFTPTTDFRELAIPVWKPFGVSLTLPMNLASPLFFALPVVTVKTNQLLIT
jgi:hypothetical protein